MIQKEDSGTSQLEPQTSSRAELSLNHSIHEHAISVPDWLLSTGFFIVDGNGEKFQILKGWCSTLIFWTNLVNLFQIRSLLLSVKMLFNDVRGPSLPDGITLPPPVAPNNIQNDSSLVIRQTKEICQNYKVQTILVLRHSSCYGPSSSDGEVHAFHNDYSFHTSNGIIDSER